MGEEKIIFKKRIDSLMAFACLFQTFLVEIREEKLAYKYVIESFPQQQQQ